MPEKSRQYITRSLPLSNKRRRRSTHKYADNSLLLSASRTKNIYRFLSARTRCGTAGGFIWKKHPAQSYDDKPLATFAKATREADGQRN